MKIPVMLDPAAQDVLRYATVEPGKTIGSLVP